MIQVESDYLVELLTRAVNEAAGEFARGFALLMFWLDRATQHQSDLNYAKSPLYLRKHPELCEGGLGALGTDEASTWTPAKILEAWIHH